MAQNPSSPDVKQIPLTTFSGEVTNLNPIALPEGSSPSCSDVQFLPGGVASRACFQRVFATPMGTATVTYGKSYVDNQGTIRNLYLDSSGNLWVENLTTSPGTYTLLTTTTPGSYARSCTAFGREYIAISDGYHGAEVPFQFDGTNLDRVTQDGPGSPPVVSSITIPATALQAPSAGSPLTVVSIETTDLWAPGGFYGTATITVTGGALAAIQVNGQIIVAGNSQTAFNVPNAVINVPDDTHIVVPFYSTSFLSGIGGTVTPTDNITLSRQNNVVTANTDTPHQLQVGFQVQISNTTAEAVGGGINQITVNNESSPGIATVETNSAHGLIPGNFVTLTGIAGSAIGGGIAAISRQGQVVTAITNSAHNLTPGAFVTIAGVSNGTFNTSVTVQGIPDSTHFTYSQADVDATSSGGTVTLNWPVTDTQTPNLYQVTACPDPTHFQIELYYSDGTWTGGAVSFAWDGTYFVQSVLSNVSFTYQQYGPNATTSTAGTVTPYGQMSPGAHQCQVAFLTRQGYLTQPSPAVKFESFGGQYVSISNLPIGPANVVARVLLFTGAGGAYFFYIPSVPQANGLIVGTATQINDNTTQSTILDFSDATLFTATAVSISGNNIAEQIILDGALGFGFYGSRLITWGQRNTVQNLLNMGFDGGYLPLTPTLPTGWDYTGTGGALHAGHYGSGWQISVTGGGGNFGTITQSLYEDTYSAPIAQANTVYRIRAWLKPSVAASDLTFTVKISSASTSFSTTATILGSLMNTNGSWLEAVFSAATPTAIPTDLLLSVYASASATTLTLLVDELSLIYNTDPYNTGLYGSYVDNPEAFDGVSGSFGPADDTHQVMGIKIIRSNLYMGTLDPGGRLHETAQGTTEPAEWTVNEVASMCGFVSAFAGTDSQADDSTASGGEEWWAWYSSTGARIFGGEYPHKINQEVLRPSGVTFPGAPTDMGNLNVSAQGTVWALNDPTNKVLYFGLPTGTNTAPNQIWQMSYLGLEAAAEIAASPPVHLSLSGKMVTRDLARKWSPWQITMNGAALMYRSPNALTPVFFGGSGQTPGTLIGTVTSVSLASHSIVTWVSGPQFSGMVPGTSITINGVARTITLVTSPTVLQVAGSVSYLDAVGYSYSSGSAYGNVYTLSNDIFTDDDYGAVNPFYVTYAMPDRDQEQQMQLGAGMKLAAYFTAFVSGVGYMTVSILYNSLANTWPLTGTGYLLSTSPTFDLEWGAGQATAQRFFVQFAPYPNAAGSTPSPATDVQFSLTSMMLALKVNKRAPVRGSYP